MPWFRRKMSKLEAPPSYSRARDRAVDEARRYSARHALSTRESLILEYSMHSAVVDHLYDPEWDGATLPIGLAELAAFRAAQIKLGSNPTRTVTVIEKAQWSAEWHEEQRLAIVFVPVIRAAADGVRTEIAASLAVRSSKLRSRLILVRAGSERCTDHDHDQTLYQVQVTPREEPFLWKGSAMAVIEGSTPVSYTHSYSSHTPVSAALQMVAPAFDFVVALLNSQQPSPDSNERLILTIGFPFAGGPLPHGRLIRPDERLTDPVRIDAATPRLWIRLDRTRLAEDPNQTKGTLMGEWMIVE